jgi:hypothetical protein
LILREFLTLGKSSPNPLLYHPISPLIVQDLGMDISKIVIPEVPIPARILESKTASKKNQKKSSTTGKAARKKAVVKSTKKRRAK